VSIFVYVGLFLLSPIIVIVSFRILFAISVLLISGVLTLWLFVFDKAIDKKGKNEKNTN